MIMNNRQHNTTVRKGAVVINAIGDTIVSVLIVACMGFLAYMTALSWGLVP